MQKISKEFAGRTFRAVIFIVLVMLVCTAVSGAGIYLATKYGLTMSVEQAPLTALSIGEEREIELPIRGRVAQGSGWKLRNSGDMFTLTLDGAVVESPVTENGSQPAISVNGDLILELKQGSSNWIHSEGVGIYNEAGTLVIKGEGSLVIQSRGEALYVNEQGDETCTIRVEAKYLEIERL